MKEKNELNNLRNNHSIIIKPCGKGNNIWIMNTRDNLTKIHTHLPSKPQYIQTTQLQPHKCNSPWCSQSHTLFYSQLIKDTPAMEFLLSQEYLHTSLLWFTKNTQTKLHCKHYCFRMWWSNWPSVILNHSLYPASIARIQNSSSKSHPPNKYTLGYTWCHVTIH